jgi:hypothetical protein
MPRSKLFILQFASFTFKIQMEEGLFLKNQYEEGEGLKG